MTEHPHFNVIMAWLNGEIIESQAFSGEWIQDPTPKFDPDVNYRIKPLYINIEKVIGVWALGKPILVKLHNDTWVEYTGLVNPLYMFQDMCIKEDDNETS